MSPAAFTPPLSGAVREGEGGALKSAASKIMQAQALASGIAETKEERIKRDDSQQVGGAYHSYDEEKVSGFSAFINQALEGDPHLAHLLPMNPESNELFSRLADGIILCKLINIAVPDSVFIPALNLGARLKNTYRKLENVNLAINSAKAIGCSVVNIGAQDLMDGKPHLVLGLLWQVLKAALVKRVTLREVPGLVLLLKEGEELQDLMRLSREDLLIRWVNYHLNRAGVQRRLANFGSDVTDSFIYAHLMNQIAPDECSLALLQEEDNLKKRAAAVLDNAVKMGCQKFLKPEHITAGNTQLNFAFVATLFNEAPCLELREEDRPSAEDLATLLDDGSDEDSREKQVYRNWINSLGLATTVNSLIEDCKTGIVLLEVMERLKPEVVAWNKINKKAGNNPIKVMQNCNAVVDVAKDMGFSVVNFGGEDLAKGNPKP
ncbi:calponin homology domain-containing protein [Baffinella frigidus]|nr:calponin homology domain-containing protein [Cryptophyta sp. CCMP2293]